MLSSKESEFVRGSEDNGKTLLHVVATIGNPELFEIVITYCGLPLNTIANMKWERFNSRRNKHIIETPLSLAILHELLNDFIKLFVKQQSKGNYLTHVDLSGTKIASFPMELFNFHHITNLNLSNNRIKDFPHFGVLPELVPQHLIELNLSHNLLASLPAEIFQLPNLQKFDASNNPLVSLPGKWWMSRSLENLSLSQTKIGDLCLFRCHRKVYTNSMVSKSKHSTRSHRILSRTALLRKDEDTMAFTQNDTTSLLRCLNVSSACLANFPKCLACFFPNLKQLNISGNNVVSCCSINELPAVLEELDMSQNNLQSDHSSIFSLSIDDTDRLCCNPDVNDARSSSCHHTKHNKLSKLTSLNLSGNKKLKTVVLNSSDDKSKSVNLFFPNLRKLNLNNCNLQQTPEHLVKLTELYSLNIGNNDVTIPQHICNLTDLRMFVYEGVKDPIALELNKFSTIKEMQIFLRQKK